MRLLLVEPDSDVQEIIIAYCQLYDFEVRSVISIDEACIEAQIDDFDGFILDVRQVNYEFWKRVRDLRQLAYRPGRTQCFVGYSALVPAATYPQVLLGLDEFFEKPAPLQDLIEAIRKKCHS